MVTNFLIAFVVPSTTARAVMLLPIVMMIMRSLRWETLRPRTGILESLWHCRGDTGQQPFTGAIVTATSSQILGYQLYQGPDRYGDFLDEVVHCLCSCCHYHTGSQLFIGKMLFKTETVLLRGEDDGPGGRVQGLGKMNGVGSAGPDYLSYHHLFVGNRRVPWSHVWFRHIPWLW